MYDYTMQEIFIFTATIHIENTKNVLANVTIYESGSVTITNKFLLEGGPQNNKSLTYISIKDAFPSSKPYVRSSIGKRQKGDKLLHFESKNVMNYNRFPSKAFSYHGTEYLTYVRFSFNVSNSLNSPQKQ